MLSFSAAIFAILAAAPQDPVDPELSSSGRTSYLGREVAQTMHWKGAGWLMRKTREDEENGELLRKWLAVKPGQSVCDFGCGNGYHTLPLAKAVTSSGVVYAVDLQPQMLVMLERASERQHLNHLRFVEATIDNPKLESATCDLILLVDVYHELSHPVRVMSHLRRALKPGGRIVLVEFRAEDPSVPIKPEHMMSKAQVIREMASHGCILVDEFDKLPWQHAMAFAPAKEVGPRLAPQQLVNAFLRAVASEDPRVTSGYVGPGVSVEDLPKLEADSRSELRAGPDGTLLATLRTSSDQPLWHGMDELVLVQDAHGCWSIQSLRRKKVTRRPHGSGRPFVAMHTALGQGSVAERVALANRVGFDGVAWNLNGLSEARKQSELLGNDLWSAYAVLDVGKGVNTRLTPVRQAIATLANGPGMLWLGIQNGQHKPRTPAGDDEAVAALQILLRDAHRFGVEIALYPHHGFWLETVDGALRLCELTKHRQLGVCFNLCHFLRNGDIEDPAPLLKRCADRLFAVTVNGADLQGQGWQTLIQPLGQGNFDLDAFLLTLDSNAFFDGPVGLQGYGIKKTAQEHLPASMAAWRKAQSGGR